MPKVNFSRSNLSLLTSKVPCRTILHIRCNAFDNLIDDLSNFPDHVRELPWRDIFDIFQQIRASFTPTVILLLLEKDWQNLN